MMTSLRTLLLGAALATAGACAASKPAASGTPAAPRVSRSTTSNVVSADELAATKEANLYDFVSQHRPRWLQPRARPGSLRNANVQGNAAASIAVYQDATRLGGIDILRTMSRDGVKSLRFYDVAEAQQRFPNRETGAVIQILTR